jgi:hypothetical protein
MNTTTPTVAKDWPVSKALEVTQAGSKEIID